MNGRRLREDVAAVAAGVYLVRLHYPGGCTPGGCSTSSRRCMEIAADRILSAGRPAAGVPQPAFIKGKEDVAMHLKSTDHRPERAIAIGT